MFTLNTVSAADGLVYPYSSQIQFKGGCTYNGTYCSSTTSCNITAFYPNGAVYVNNIPTTNQLTYFNATLPQVSTLGEYSAKLVCYDPIAGFSGTEEFTFKVTSTGGTQGGNLTIFLLLIGVSVIVFIISLVIKNEYVGALSAFLLTCSGLYLAIYGIGIEYNLYTKATGFILIGIGVVLIIMTAYTNITKGDGFATVSSKDNSDDNDIFNYKQEDSKSEEED